MSNNNPPNRDSSHELYNPADKGRPFNFQPTTFDGNAPITDADRAELDAKYNQVIKDAHLKVHGQIDDGEAFGI
jgi:hypothetical protein